MFYGKTSIYALEHSLVGVRQETHFSCTSVGVCGVKAA